MKLAIFVWLFAMLLLNGCALFRGPEPVTPGLLFSDNMVLQRHRPIRIFGTAPAGTWVRVDFKDRGGSACAGKTGEWSVEFPAEPAGGPYQLRIRGGGTDCVFRNVMVGDVWFAAGQSNMDWPLNRVLRAPEELDTANHPLLRLLKIPAAAAPAPLANPLRVSGWQPATRESAAGFSAVGYFFGRELVWHLNIPIGIIQAAKGGSPIEPWMPGPEAGPGAASQSWGTEYRKKLRRLEFLESAAGRDERVRIAENPPPGRPIPVPGEWERHGYPGFDGMMLYTRSVELPADWCGRDLELELGCVDEVDRTLFNGVEIDGRGDSATANTAYWNRPRHYRIPGKLVREGKNVLAVFVSDLAGGGGLIGRAPIQISPENDVEHAIPLEGAWEVRPLLEMPALPASGATYCNAMVAPCFRIPVKGVIWYQGCSNVGRANRYENQLKSLISNWRRGWKIPDLPFYVMQLANITTHRSAANGAPWAQLREAQRRAVEATPNAGLAVAIDIGDARDIHPRNKQEAGRRLAMQALCKQYGFKPPPEPDFGVPARLLVADGPRYDSFRVEDNEVKVEFNAPDAPLKPDPALRGFEVAGADGVFHPAQARVDGPYVIASSPEVPNPCEVRYGWADNPDCNLVNVFGMPASPFTSVGAPRKKRE